MKKADPDTRAHCKQDESLPSAPPNARTLVCQNVTMAQFADRLQNLTPDLRWPVLDETGLGDTWDLTLSFTQFFGGMGPGRVAAPAPGSPVPMASDPTGGVTIFEAVQKQLGLKLESRKRPEPVIVIDHIEQQPTEN